MEHSANLSLWDLFVRADWIVKSVMVMLLVASIWVWGIVIEKLVRLRRLRREADAFEDTFWSGGSLEDLHRQVGDAPGDPMSAIFVAGMDEWKRSAERGLLSAERPRAGFQERLDRVMNITLGREMDRVERYMTFLASVGSTAPFIGLFGTVWGIMNAFQAIAVSKNTSLAVVAPGIAEALFATAMGLVAAIPAVVAYNKLSSDLARYGGRLEDFADEFGAILSRMLDERRG